LDCTATVFRKPICPKTISCDVKILSHLHKKVQYLFGKVFITILLWPSAKISSIFNGFSVLSPRRAPGLCRVLFAFFPKKSALQGKLCTSFGALPVAAAERCARIAPSDSPAPAVALPAMRHVVLRVSVTCGYPAQKERRSLPQE
ncbi:MAG: hypothetical protein LUF77_06260, partial [Oscillospiraceae bacterium]|nr:hypothetical protein [Oscillospiraceae bacterium]